MSITILTGLPGSGKSAYLIDVVNAETVRDRSVHTFSCGESPTLLAQGRGNYGILASRRPGLTCPLHHFVSTRECGEILDRLPPGTLAVFDEAYHFGPDVALHWIEASRRGLDVMMSTPSGQQLRLLEGHNYTERAFPMECERCSRDAVTCIVSVSDNTTLSVCVACETNMTQAARTDILDRLIRQDPYPGETVIYQPVELSECADWRVLRPDSANRVGLMTHVVREFGLLEGGQRTPTYLDVGCNTGYFCHSMRRLGFHAEGEDVVREDIEVARLLDTFVRKDGNTYVVADAYDYLHDTEHRRFDVTSAFAVFQWLMIQTTVERAIKSLELLFEKTTRVCFLEMGYSSEEQYAGRLPPNIDRSWVFNVMQERGAFAEIRMYDAGHYGLMFGSRDLFVGIKRPIQDDSQSKPSRRAIDAELISAEGA